MSDVAIVAAVTASPPSASVNQPMRLLSAFVATGSVPTAHSFVTARVDSPTSSPPFASNVTVHTFAAGGVGSTYCQ